MPSISRRGDGGNKSTQWSPARITALGEFLGSARWIMTPNSNATPEQNFTPERAAPDWKENFAETPDSQNAGDTGSDTELGPLLGAIADDVHAIAGAAREGVLADFAARVAHARRHQSGPQLLATLAALAQARKAALAVVKQNAALELAGRKKAALTAHRLPRLPKNKRTRWNHAQRDVPERA
jgi:hypothetical protein